MNNIDYGQFQKQAREISHDYFKGPGSLVPDYERKQILDQFTLRGYSTCNKLSQNLVLCLVEDIITNSNFP